MIGKVIDGKYEIKQPIGEPSGMGDVYLAVEKIGGHEARKVVIKFAREGLAENEMGRFREEMLLLARLEHENIARIYHWGHWGHGGSDAGGRPYFVMEYLSGVSLYEFITEKRILGRGLDLTLVNEITRQACAGLQFAHERGVIHRDIKPQNIMILDSDGKLTVKVIDFGIAKSAEGVTRRATTGAIGTPNYMSPEQINPSKLGPVDPRTDVYSMGLVVHEMLTGKMAVAGSEIAEVVHKQLNETPPPSNVHPKIDAVVNQALKKSSGERPQTIRQFASQLNDAVRLAQTQMDEPTQPLPPTPSPKAKAMWAIAALLAVLTSGYFAIQYWRGEVAQTNPGLASSMSVSTSPAPTVVTPPRPAERVEAHAMTVYRMGRDNREEPVPPETVFNSREYLRFTVTPPMDGFVYLIQRGSQGDLTLLFPDSRMRTKTNAVTGGKEFLFPPAGANGKPQWFKFDERPGDETIYAFFAKEKTGKLVEVIERDSKRNKRTALDQIELDNGIEAMLREAMKQSDGSSVKQIKLSHVK